MPVKTWDTKEDFDDAYSIRLERYTGGHPNTRPELRGHYERRALFNDTIPQLDYVTPEWERIVAHFDWPLETSICILGVGFGWTIEYLNSRGYTDVWGIDDSTYIQDEKNAIDPTDGKRRSNVGARIHNASFPSMGEINRFLRDSDHQQGFEVCITERVLSSLNNGEIIGLATAMSRIAITPEGQLIHIEIELDDGRRDPEYNWKTAEDWRALLPDDIFVFNNGRDIG